MANEGISWWRTSLGPTEAARLVAAIGAGRLSEGPITAEFEAAFAARLGVPHAIAVPSGSAALLLAMLALGVGPGDEVIVPDSTWIASAHGAALLGARVVLVDTRCDRPLLDIDAVAARITSRTKAIVPVHLAGRAVDMTALLSLANRHGIAVIEDACQALLSSSAAGLLGTLGAIGCYSLGVAKLLNTGQGGMIVTRDSALHQALLRCKFHGVGPADGWERYERLGFNAKYTDMMAAIGLVQLERAEARVAHVTAIYRRYCQGLEGLTRLRVSPIALEAGELPLWTEIETPELAALVDHLAGCGIQTRRLHPPLHRAGYLGNSGEFPNADAFSARLLVLPSGPDQPLAAVDTVIASIRAWHG